MIYKRISEFIKNLKYNSIVDNLLRRPPLFYNRFYNDLKKIDTYNKDKKRRVVGHNLKRVLQIASNSRYAKKNNLNSLNIEDWPILEKSTVRDNAEKLLTRNKLFTISASTSGSTGIPIKLYRSLSSISYEQATIDYIVNKAGGDFKRSNVGIFRGDDIKSPDDTDPPFWKQISSSKVAFSSTHLSPETIDHYYSFIKESDINLLIGYPSALEELLRNIFDVGNLPKVKAVITSSEVLDNSTRRFFKKVCPNSVVIDYYGLAERMVFAYSFDGENYFFLPTYAYVEFLFNSSDEQYDYYEIVGTSFINDAMPFIRFKTGDLMKVPRDTTREKLEDIRLGLEPFQGIVGRTIDYLITSEGERLVGMTLIPRGVEHISQAQIYQKSYDHVVINVIPQGGYNSEDESKLLKNARTKIPNSFKIEVQKVDALLKSESGKAPYVLRNSKLKQS
ncbi:hypothetical protein [Rhodohalobacter sp. 8-1]|uniref:hypothetical protein n=1 Tax=Rhodohalobacter sp. 8-1 TaxID=3131972 RepID=UPI0030EBC3CA